MPYLPGIFFTVYFLLLTSGAISQPQRVFHRFSHADGLNTNKVNCVWQDKTGFLWIGTENGLQRFDGKRFVWLRNTMPGNEIPPLGVSQILDAGNNKIWLLQGSLAGRFDLTTFIYQPVPVRIDNPSQKSKEGLRLYKDSKGNVFLCDRTHGLFIYDSVKNIFTDKNVPVKTPPGWPVRNILEDAQAGEYWISSDSGLAVYQNKTQQLYYKKNNPQHIGLLERNDLENIRVFFIARDQTYWIAFWKFKPLEGGFTLIHYDPRNNKILPDTLGIHPMDFLYQVMQTRKGEIWLAGLNALFTYDTTQKRFYQHLQKIPFEFGIQSHAVNHIYEDRDENLWFSTDNGLYVINRGGNSVFNMAVANKENSDVMVESILETKNGEKWIGGWGAGLVFLDRNNKKINNATPATGHKEADRFYRQVYDCRQYSYTSQIWMVCQGGYMAIVDPATKKIIQALHPPVFENETIRRVREDKEGNLWFITMGGKLVKWKRNNKTENTAFALVKQFHTGLSTLLIDDKGRIWLGTISEGIYVLDAAGENLLYHFNENNSGKNSLQNNSISDMEQYNDSLFFANGGGLNLVNIRTGTVENKTINNGLPTARISQMKLDEKGILWMTTNNGLLSYNYPKDVFISYNESDGIVYGDKEAFTKCRMKNGEIWFGGENVVYGFSPERLKLDVNPPEVLITDFRLINDFQRMDSLKKLDKINLKSYQHSIAFYFSALNFLQQDKLVYYYKLEGIDREWIKADWKMLANYSYLPPGNYTFKVRCENMHGMSSGISSMRIYIAPPFYQTWWFISLLILAALFIIYIIYSLRIKRLLALEKLRTKVARDLHDDMGSTLSTINILSSMAKTKLSNDTVKTSEYISKISDNSQRMMEAMDDIVWSIKPDNDSMQKITARMREFATHVLEAKNMEFSFRIDEKVNHVKLNMEARRDFFLIFKETINNIAKYSKCSRVDAHISYHDKRLLLKIQDNGIGFDVEKADNGNGIGNMKKRAEALRGRIQIESVAGSGTKVMLNIPAS
jgi:signal transduction histidine kinase/ligand-binding sensor domain-containing protein